MAVILETPRLAIRQFTGRGEFLGWFHFRPGPGGDITNIDLG